MIDDWTKLSLKMIGLLALEKNWNGYRTNPPKNI